MSLSYELARRHYQIQRILELEPGTRAYERIAPWLQDLPLEALVELFEHAPQAYLQLIPLCLLCRRFEDFNPAKLASTKLKAALDELFSELSQPLIQELERLIHDEKLSRYPFVRSLLLQEIRFHQSYSTRSSGIEQIDRDRFRQYLGGYVYLLRSGMGNPYLTEAWNETGWLRRWQLDSTPARQLLPVQTSLRGQIAKYKLSEPAKLLYAELDQIQAQPDLFISQLEAALENYLKDYPVRLNDQLENRIRDLVQVVMRHAMKKGYRVESLSQKLLKGVIELKLTANPYDSGFITYIVMQELILATQNLKYRLNDCLNGIAKALAETVELPGSELRWFWAQHALLDGVMEIYESFTLADNSLKAFVDHYQQAVSEHKHQSYDTLATHLRGLFQHAS